MMFANQPTLEADLHRLLPLNLLDDLSRPDKLREALQHLNSLERAVVSFLPSYITEDRALFGDAALTESSVRDSGSLRSGVFMFADVSGFTALSEKLQQRGGAVGTEILTAVINQYFETMLEVLAKSEGQLLKFAGDALLAFFPTTRGPEDSTPALQAVRAGLRMQRAMREKFQPIKNDQLIGLLGSDHGSQLTMSIGIARGRLFEALVGNMTQRDHIIQGGLPGEAMQAEGVGERDEVIVAPDIADILGDRFTYQPLGEGYLQVVDNVRDLDDFETTLLNVRRRQGVAAGLFDLEQENLLDSLNRQTQKVKRVGLYVPPTVLSGLIHSEDLHLPRENRYTATMFIHATGFAVLLAEWGEEELVRLTDYLGRYYSLVQRIIGQYGGTLTRTDPYKLGFKLLSTFGAPIQHSDDPYRAVTAAVELNHALAQFNQRIHEELPEHLRRESYIHQRMGITLGETFSGEAGWKQRREYTVMGDDVNLAARLMAHAEYGQILVSERIYQQVRQSFQAQALPPLNLKGKKKPVQTYIIADDIESAGLLTAEKEMPFIGHELFMLKLDLLLQQARLGRVKALSLVGDAGIGKTRIARQFAETAKAAKFQVAWVTCQARSRRSVWASLIAQLLNIDLNTSSTARSQLSEQLNLLNLKDLELPVSNLLFGAAQGGGNVAIKRATDEMNATQTKIATGENASQSANNQAELHDLFAAVQRMSKDDMKKSGLFGLMARRMEVKADDQTQRLDVAPNDTSGFYKSAERATSIEQAITRFLSSYSQKQPTLIVLDDLHQANDEALGLLNTVLKNVSRGQLVILANYEPLSVNVEMKVEVVPDLGEDETSRVAMAILHVSELGERLQRLLWERTSGRPLYIESLLRTLLDRDYLEISSGRADLSASADVEALPEDVRQLVISRIDRLSPETQHVIRVAAVVGDEFTPRALQVIGELDTDEALQMALAEMTQAQLVESQDDGTIAFRHGMTRAVIYETLSRAQRAKLHRASATYYRTLQGDEAQPIAAAYHLAKCGLLPQAIEILTNAGENAETAGRIDEAMEFYSYALTLMPDEKSLQTRLDALREVPLPA